MGHEGFTGTSALLYHVHPPTTVKSVKRLMEIEARGRRRPDAAAPALPHVAREEGRQPDARSHSAAVQSGRRDAVRRARQGGRALLPQRAGGRGGVRREGEGHARDGVRRSAVRRRATTSSSIAASCTATASTRAASRRSCSSWRAAGTCARPSATATSSASSWRARRTPSATSACRASSRRTTRWATSASS